MTAARKRRSQNVNTDQAQRTMEPKDYCGFILRTLKAMGRRAGDADPESLKLFVELRQALDEAEAVAIQALLDEGYSYRDLAKPLGVRHTAIFQRMLRRRESRECA